MTEMERDDYHDFLEHPDWFYADPLREFVRPNAIMKQVDPEGYQRALDYMVNPPAVLRRKPVPFVLPIKGSAL
jgi:hypothetical protein